MRLPLNILAVTATILSLTTSSARAADGDSPIISESEPQPSDQGQKLCDFRLYSTAGCVDSDMGIFSIYEGGVSDGGCYNFGRQFAKALNMTAISPACKMYGYLDKYCEYDKTWIEQDTCQEAHGWVIGVYFKSFTMECDSDFDA
ncbi:hypothetical protein B0I35DRAFT_474040 [Stachybotrys elegans]|uniref:Ecp2 effector protein domain-containing protein n=1 Tax=Stachybotrys elegans TaxID=80388 RepID=A0A8K0T0F1_9HYPO|nr:hypothetical protein B0I35DRAFT_474040 [Stachybotrys elegans]